MKLFLSFALLMVFIVPGTAQQPTLPAYNADAVLKRASAPDTVYVINFWASWCPPCVLELPEFNKLQAAYADKPVKILLVSLDFKDDYPMRLAEFVRKKRIIPEVVWFSETDPNAFLPKIDKSWEGSIPATLIIQPGKKYRKFTESTMNAGQLSTIIDAQLK
jgi:thiol-disulfide isomerase/thioredoxin